MNKVFGDRRAIAFLLGPALAVYTLFMLVPIVWSLGYLFFDGNAIRGFEFVGLQNFVTLFNDPAAGRATWFTIRIALAQSVLQIVVAYLLALLYTFVLKRSSAIVRTLVFFPIVMPTVAVGLMFRQMFQSTPNDGLVNALLGVFGIESVNWLGDPNAAFWVVVIMDLWRAMGFYAVLLYAGLVDIPEEVIESARLDGASGLRLVWSIVLPLSRPVLFAAIIFNLNVSLKIFDPIIALTNGGPGDTTTPLTLYMFQTSFLYGDYGYGSTIAFALAVLCLIVTVFIFRSSRRDVTENPRTR